MGIFSFLRKKNVGECSFSYPEVYVPVSLPEPTFNPEYDGWMPSGNSLVLRDHHLLDWGYDYRTTGTFVNTGNYLGNSTVRCEHCGRKNNINNEFCAGCGANL